MSMSREEAILLSAYKGFLLAPDFSEVHKFCEDTLGRPIWTHEFADNDVQKKIQEKLRPQIVELVQNIAALRGPKREMVERMFPGCKMCQPVCHKCKNYPLALYPQACKTCVEHSKFEPISNFCEDCGRPMTEKALDMIMERWKEEVDNEAD